MQNIFHKPRKGKCIDIKESSHKDNVMQTKAKDNKQT